MKGEVFMKVVGLSIEEKTSEKTGKSYLVLILNTDDKDNPNKILGYVNPKIIRTIPLKNKD